MGLSKRTIGKMVFCAALFACPGCAEKQCKMETASVNSEQLPQFLATHKNVKINAVATSEKPRQTVLLVTGEVREDKP